MHHYRVTILGTDPVNRKNNINGLSYQQDALTTYNGWQYAVFYASKTHAPEPLYLHLARRPLARDDWEVLTPDQFDWSARHFTTTLDSLPGLVASPNYFVDVSYPRFLSVGDDLLFTHRLGRAGCGSDVLYQYYSRNATYSFIGQHLTGVDNNPYINGLDHHNGRLHITWTYRGFVWYEGWDDPFDIKHKLQAGPNGAENNYNLCYAFSDDLGITWKNGHNVVVADISQGQSVMPDMAGLWTSNPIPGLESSSIGRRGDIAIDGNNNLYLALPDSAQQKLRILKASHSSGYARFQPCCEIPNCHSEPRIDKVRLSTRNELTILSTQADAEGTDSRRVVVFRVEADG
ncbi:hypothetical protein B0A52_06719 [Exophiala mesophila]|uniref:Uncharacterized protein n=1 Tax=Exophiala mesophila TaxID=212818 RepID=A0A438N1Q0_EXOME|nr:hypothetical protein B0A52_06719 [Exophiala mesophila]